MKQIQPFTFIDLFAGIGGMRIAFERAGGRCMFSSEWDSEAQKTYAANFGEVPHGDIAEIPAGDIPDHDILAAGFPCQAFSIMGDRRGFADTRGTLFFEVERILCAKRPKAVMLENVKQLVKHDHGQTFKVILDRLSGLGYHVQWSVLNALDFGIPQKRERVIIVGFLDDVPFMFPKHNGPKLRLEDILEDDSVVPQKCFASEAVRESERARLKRKPPYPSIWHENKGRNISPNEFACALRANASYNYLLVNGTRRLTSRENLRFMGFPEDFKIVVKDSSIRTQCGNSVVIPVVSAVAKQMVEAMNQDERPSSLKAAVQRLPNGQLAFT